jgi:hypothetical protein
LSPLKTQLDHPVTQEEIKALIEAEQARWTELHERHFVGLTDISMIVLKGHLLVEQLLTSLLSHHCHSPSQLRKARLRFVQKVALVKAIVILPFPDQLWGFLDLINQLRNDIAHELEPELKEHFEIVRAMTDRRIKIGGVPAEFEATFETDEGRLSSLISFWLGLLGSADSILQLMKKAGKFSTAHF